jgi:hypothetical protein
MGDMRGRAVRGGYGDWWRDSGPSGGKTDKLKTLETILIKFKSY